MLSAALAAAAAPLVDPREAGVLTSNLSAPCGSKTPPLVVHSPMGTLYEEPCINVIKITVGAELPAACKCVGSPGGRVGWDDLPPTAPPYAVAVCSSLAGLDAVFHVELAR